MEENFDRVFCEFHEVPMLKLDDAGFFCCPVGGPRLCPLKKRIKFGRYIRV